MFWIEFLDFICCYQEPRDDMPYQWDYHEYTLRKIMNRLWVLYEREVPLRSRALMSQDALLFDALDEDRITRWYITDRKFKDLVSFFTARNGTCQVISSNNLITWMKAQI